MFLATVHTLLAQQTLIVGQVFDNADQSPIANASIYFKNTNIGTSTGDEGYFMLRHTGNENILVVSSVGYKTREIRIKAGQMAGMQIGLTEQNLQLQEVFIVPGANPALPLLDKVRAAKTQYYNNMPGAAFDSETESLVLLNKINQRQLSKKIYEQLAIGNLNSTDSLLTLPLYALTEKHSYNIPEKQRTLHLPKGGATLPEGIFSSLMHDSDADINIYDNSWIIFNRPFVSPLATTANSFYHFFLSDSIANDSSKLYRINFRPKNPKHLCFNGHMWINAHNYNVRNIVADMSVQANINFVRRLQLQQQFGTQNAYSTQNKSLTANMYFDALADSSNRKPEIFVHRNILFNYSNWPTHVAKNANFAGSQYNTDSIDTRISNMAQTPLLRTANYIANVLITGYMPIGAIDIGKVQHIARTSETEGLRLTLPFRTNEKLFPNFSLLGHAGYGFANKKIKFAAGAQYRLAFEKRSIVGIKYTDDYRRIDYDYNDIVLRESPLLSGDEDIAITIFALRKATQLHQRKEFDFWLKNNWTPNFETTLLASQHTLFANNAFMPLITAQGEQHNAFSYQSLTLNARLSKNENVIDDFLDQIYLYNTQPVLYTTAEMGRFAYNNANKNFARVKLSLKQQLRFDHFQWNYLLETGAILGTVAYPLLKTPAGSETWGFKRYQFNLMNYREYAADKYVAMHNEISLNGFIMNEIPLIKHLNLRELFTMKLFYGALNNKHNEIYTLPTNAMHATQKPYVEVGAGISNFLGIFTAQFVWRLTDRHRNDVEKWGIRTGIKVSF